ncbi:hypothetical protein MLD38_017761 [Melastoma candidum]|uniref:Uncharacterized protein n=1 Tax=Melastoma candidum TaxID=119954 RepID=A0ACB9QS90_9MYRT|nr:hypothetical protein MLD38_017761 [Melastoma candidum]
MSKVPMEKTATVPSRPITTFVQTDTLSFREVVQRLTGGPPSDDNNSPSPSPVNNPKRPTPSLHERRHHYTRQRLEIAKPNVLRFGPGIDDTGSLVSPSSRSSMRSPGTPATTPTSNFSKLSIAERRSRPPPPRLPIDKEEEERAIKERRFYLHPSPRSKGQEAEQPELLNLFPLTSPTSGGATPSSPLPKEQ